MWGGSDLMAYEPTIWKNREVEKPRTFTMQDNGDGTITLIPAEGIVTEPGTPIMAANMNKIEVQLKLSSEHIDNKEVHIQPGERNKWNSYPDLYIPQVATKQVNIADLDNITDPFVICSINDIFWYVETRFFAKKGDPQKLQIAYRYNQVGDMMTRSFYNSWSPWSPSLQSLFQSVSNGKTQVANAITEKGVYTSPIAEFATIASNIRKLTGYATGTFVNTQGLAGRLAASGLSFEPKVVVAFSSSIGRHLYFERYSPTSNGYTAGITDHNVISGDFTVESQSRARAKSDATFTASSFSIPIFDPSNNSYVWHAFG